MERGLNTLCIHSGVEAKNETGFENYGAISYPIYQTATFAHGGINKSTGYDYSRMQNPTRNQLERIVTNLENGSACIALSSGMAAITLVMELFEPGDHILVESDLYGGSIRLFENISKKNRMAFTYMDFSDEKIEESIEKNIQSNTKAIYIETPTNPMMKIADISLIAKVAKRHNCLLIVDNTFLTPYFQNPLDLGADIVIHSGTKYLGGHNDTLAGLVVTLDHVIDEKLRFLAKTTGAVLAPFDCWLVLRGIKTLGIRMEQSQKNAIKIAEFLESQDKVDDVFYPGLPTHKGHEILKKQARGYGAMLTFNVNTQETAYKILEKVRIIKFAESLGGVETLITYPTTQTHADVPESKKIKNGITPRTLRLSVGIEDVQDLITELNDIFNEL